MRLTTEEKVCMALRHRDVLDFGPKLTHSLNARLKVLKVPCAIVYTSNVYLLYMFNVYFICVQQKTRTSNLYNTI